MEQQAQLMLYQQQLQTVEMQLIQNPGQTEVGWPSSWVASMLASPLLLCCSCVLWVKARVHAGVCPPLTWASC